MHILHQALCFHHNIVQFDGNGLFVVHLVPDIHSQVRTNLSIGSKNGSACRHFLPLECSCCWHHWSADKSDPCHMHISQKVQLLLNVESAHLAKKKRWPALYKSSPFLIISHRVNLSRQCLFFKKTLPIILWLLVDTLRMQFHSQLSMIIFASPAPPQFSH